MFKYSVGDRVFYRNWKFVVISTSLNNFKENFLTLVRECDSAPLKSFIQESQVKPIIKVKDGEIIK